jgi:hypothetical protein
MVTDHGALRVAERLHLSADRAEQALDALWSAGREARAGDFEAFHTQSLPGRLYRVAVRKGAMFMVVRNCLTMNFITIIKRT